MSQPAGAYFTATRHPWSTLLFVLPLLAAYEGAVLTLAPAQPEALRNGADIWLRWTLARIGLRQLYWPPALLLTGLLAWAWLRRRDRPHEFFATWIGMVMESAAFAVCLWGVSRGLRPLLEGLGLPLHAGSEPEPALAQAVCFLGAGIYEEALFRLTLLSALCWLLLQSDLPHWGARLLAAAATALFFAAAHNIGPHGEEFQGAVFLFRTVAGLYFAALFQVRGFGIAVGAHAGYDVLVGVIVPTV
jgi:membrane protease YdiL (CAAX protease family)